MVAVKSKGGCTNIQISFHVKMNVPISAREIEIDF